MIPAIVLLYAPMTLPAIAWCTSAKDVFAEAAASLVVVLALDERNMSVTQGSGVVVDDYEVVTNCHTLDGADALVVRQAGHGIGGNSYGWAAAVLRGNRERARQTMSGPGALVVGDAYQSARRVRGARGRA